MKYITDIKEIHERNIIDKTHGPVVDTKVTEIAWIFTHKDGFKEVIYKEDMEVQEPQVW